MKCLLTASLARNRSQLTDKNGAITFQRIASSLHDRLQQDSIPIVGIGLARLVTQYLTIHPGVPPASVILRCFDVTETGNHAFNLASSRLTTILNIFV
jgi:hypothetical protein